MTAQPKPAENNKALREKIENTLTRNVLGGTMVMVENCYLNMSDDEFDKFLLSYSKRRHTYEPGADRCDGCNGVSFAVDDLLDAIQEHVAAVIGEDTDISKLPFGNAQLFETAKNNVRAEQRKRAGLPEQEEK